MSSFLNPVKFKHLSHHLMATHLPQATNGPNVKGGVRLLQERDSQVWYQALLAVPGEIETQSLLSKGSKGMGKEKERFVNGVARPARNSGLNPSGNPSGSQLNRPSEIIRVPPLSTASLPPVAPDEAALLQVPPVAPDAPLLPPVAPAPDAASLPPVAPPDVASLPPVAPDAASLPPVPSDVSLFSHNSTDFTRVYNFTAAQGDNGGYADDTPLGHYDSELSSNAMDYLQDFNNANLLSDPFQVHAHHSTTDSDTASLLHGISFFARLRVIINNRLSDPFPAHHSTTNVSSLLPEQPLRPGEVTRGGIAQPLPVPAWRIASAGADRPQGSGTRVDVLAHHHARRPPYQLPPTPALTSPSEASFPDNSRAGSPTEGTSTSTSTTGRTRAARTQPSQPVDCQEALSHAKRQFRLNLLTVNAMWPDLSAKVHADDQLASARVAYGLETGEVNLPVTARQLVRGNSYDIFLPHYQSPEDARKYTANKVAALLNQATGAWMHNGVDEKGVKNYFEHPAVEETIVRTIFATPRSIGSRYSDKLGSLCTPTLALACCALSCALEEWLTGTYSAVTFEVAVYRGLYHTIADLNIQQLLRKPYLRNKLMALWARIHNRGCQMVTSQRGGPGARTVQLFVEDVEVGQLAEDDAFFPTDELAQNTGWQL
ncbi:hypothetical protein EDB85DRAFT_2154261 [Lactarius pseudohatsudake]|nr:hypothetical protein EDB85DRAFT_2154261 [Lactarius pseudohatsudake]